VFGVYGPSCLSPPLRVGVTPSRYTALYNTPDDDAHDRYTLTVTHAVGVADRGGPRVSSTPKLISAVGRSETAGDGYVAPMCRMCSLDSAAPLHRHMHETRDSIQRSGMPETGFDRHHHSAPPRRPRLTTGTCISVTPPRDGRGLAAAAAHPFPYKARAPAKARPRAPRSATLRSSPPVQRYSTLLSAP
jgi:hypothetical protein